MTDREKAIVMAYTGTTMLKGNKFHIFHDYVEHIMGRSIMTHEFVDKADEIKERARPDFIALCENDEILNLHDKGEIIMNTKTNPIFTENVLEHLSQLPEGTIIDINHEHINVFANFRDLEDYAPMQHHFYKTTIWVDEKGDK